MQKPRMHGFRTTQLDSRGFGASGHFEIASTSEETFTLHTEYTGAFVVVATSQQHGAAHSGLSSG